MNGSCKYSLYALRDNVRNLGLLNLTSTLLVLPRITEADLSTLMIAIHTVVVLRFVDVDSSFQYS